LIALGLFIGSKAFTLAAQDSLQIVDTVKSGPCKISIISESEAQIESPDSTIKVGTLNQSGDYCIVKKTFIDSLRIEASKRNDSVSTATNEKPNAIDPLTGFSLLGQNAYVQRKYPVGLVNTEGFFQSVCASVTPSTLVWLDIGILHNLSSIRFGIKQQVYAMKEKDFAIAVLGAFTNLDESYYYYQHLDNSDMQYEIDGQILVSKRFFKNGNIHAGLIYLFARGYTHDYSFVDGIYHYNYKKQLLHHFGFMAGIDFQPSRNIKILLDYSDQFRFYTNQLSHQYRDYSMSAGFRFLMRRVTLDLAALENRNFETFPIRPLIRISFFFGNY
jgi:hypothetical protein